MLPLLIDAAREMNGIYWMQAYGDRDSLIRSLSDPAARELADINVGPWDRLDNNASFVPGVGPKPVGANFYPRDMTRAEFERAVAGGGARADSLKSLYTMVRRSADGSLRAIPYSRFFAAANQRAATKLREAAALAENAGLKRYLGLLATALTTDQYHPSDLAWMDMKTNTLDLVLGPIETYEDELFGYKAANESFVLIKDQSWSKRLAKYAKELPAPAARAARRRRVQARDARAPTQTSMPTTSCTSPARRTPAPRRSPSTCRTTRTCSSRRARGDCSSRTRCAPSSIASSCRSRASSSSRTSCRTSPSMRSSRTSCSTRWRTDSASRTRSTGRAPCAPR